MSVRFGIGVDVHPLVEGEKLVLGGVTIPHGRGLEGHSDGDALTHAVIDALLGAAGLGDIGTHFPSGDDRYRGVASTDLLSQVVEMIGEHDWRVQYLDATILAEQPLLRPYIGDIRAALAAAMRGCAGAGQREGDYHRRSRLCWTGSGESPAWPSLPSKP